MIGDPPLLPGVVQDRSISEVEATVAVSPVGAPGTAATQAPPTHAGVGATHAVGVGVSALVQ